MKIYVCNIYQYYGFVFQILLPSLNFIYILHLFNLNPFYINILLIWIWQKEHTKMPNKFKAYNNFIKIKIYRIRIVCSNVFWRYNITMIGLLIYDDKFVWKTRIVINFTSSRLLVWVSFYFYFLTGYYD